jgi:hypothetical protein
MNINISMRNGSEGTYGGYTASIADFTTGRRAGMERATAFAVEERKRKGLNNAGL